KQNIKYFGAGNKDDNFNNPLVIRKNLCLLSYNLILDPNKYENTAASFNRDQVKREIKEMKRNNIENIIVNIHWGIEESPQRNNEQIEIGRFLIDAGADLVIGHHPHCLQPFAIYKGKHIFYSIGNCIFPNHNCESFFNDQLEPERYFKKRLPK